MTTHPSIKQYARAAILMLLCATLIMGATSALANGYRTYHGIYDTAQATCEGSLTEKEEGNAFDVYVSLRDKRPINRTVAAFNVYINGALVASLPTQNADSNPAIAKGSLSFDGIIHTAHVVPVSKAGLVTGGTELPEETLHLLPMGAGSAPIPELQTAVVRNPNPRDRLHLRTRPSTKADSLGKYYNGVVVYLKSAQEGGWVKVQIGDLSGYMEAKYLLIGATTGVPSAMPLVTVQNKGSSGLHLRTGQSTASRSLGLMPNGTTMQVMGITQSWYHVLTHDGKTGFVAAFGITPRLSYHLDAAATRVPYFPSAPIDPKETVFDGPSAGHETAAWPFGIQADTAYVYNPNPKDRLHLRSEPNTNSNSFGKYYNGVQVHVVSYPNAEWALVRIGDSQSGYMKRAFLLPANSAATPPTSVMPLMTVDTHLLNLRESPLMGAKILGQYKQDTQIILMGFTPEWAHVIVDGKTGFMMTRYLK